MYTAAGVKKEYAPSAYSRRLFHTMQQQNFRGVPVKRPLRLLFLPLCCCLLYLLAFPAQALAGARDGLLLWYRSVLPVLLPFMLVSGILMKLGLPGRLLDLLHGPLHLLFGCSRYGAFAVLTGFLCGFPMGAKVTSDLYRQGKISRGEAKFLYGFVNNLSPAFILSYLAADQMRTPRLKGLFLCNILGAAALYGVITSIGFRRSRKGNATGCAASEPAAASGVSRMSSIFPVIDGCINDSVLNVVRLGVYIMAFSMLSRAVAGLIDVSDPQLLFAAACIEVTNGVHLLSASALPFAQKYVLVCACAAFGGLSALAQTVSIAGMDREMLSGYIKSRATIALLAACCSLGSVLCVLVFRR